MVFTPDGKRALAVRFAAHKISVLDISGDKVTYNKQSKMFEVEDYGKAPARIVDVHVEKMTR